MQLSNLSHSPANKELGYLTGLTTQRTVLCNAEYRPQGVKLKEAIVRDGAEKDNDFEHGEKKMLCQSIYVISKNPSTESDSDDV